MDPSTPARSRVRRLLAPLRSVSTVLTGVYLVIGGVVAGAYLVLVVGFAQMFAAEELPVATVVMLAVVTTAIALLPPFLGAVRTIEILVVRTLLDLDLPVPERGRPVPLAARWRAAAWYALHLCLGAAGVLGLLVAVPAAVQLLLVGVGLDRTEVLVPVHEIGGALGSAASVLAAVLLLLALPYAAWLARTVLRQAAGPLLGPDQSERIAELEAAAHRSAHRDRLAHELHDSVGHALTVTTLQAAAATRTLASDLAATRRSLDAIAATGRAAMADLDHVLGLLREPDGGPERAGGRPTPPVRTLADLTALVADSGVTVVLDVDPPGLLDRGAVVVPRAVSAETFRVVQEALTNVARHAHGQAATIRVAVVPGRLEVSVTNPVGDATMAGPALGREEPGGGRGLVSMAQRARLLGGETSAGVLDTAGGALWRVRVRFPLGDAGAATAGSAE